MLEVVNLFLGSMSVDVLGKVMFIVYVFLMLNFKRNGMLEINLELNIIGCLMLVLV